MSPAAAAPQTAGHYLLHLPVGGFRVLLSTSGWVCWFLRSSSSLAAGEASGRAGAGAQQRAGFRQGWSLREVPLLQLVPDAHVPGGHLCQALLGLVSVQMRPTGLGEVTLPLKTPTHSGTRPTPLFASNYCYLHTPRERADEKHHQPSEPKAAAQAAFAAPELRSHLLPTPPHSIPSHPSPCAPALQQAAG